MDEPGLDVAEGRGSLTGWSLWRTERLDPRARHLATAAAGCRAGQRPAGSSADALVAMLMEGGSTSAPYPTAGGGDDHRHGKYRTGFGKS